MDMSMKPPFIPRKSFIGAGESEPNLKGTIHAIVKGMEFH